MLSDVAAESDSMQFPPQKLSRVLILRQFRRGAGVDCLSPDEMMTVPPSSLKQPPLIYANEDRARFFNSVAS